MHFSKVRQLQCISLDEIAKPLYNVHMYMGIPCVHRFEGIKSYSNVINDKIIKHCSFFNRTLTFALLLPPSKVVVVVSLDCIYI